MANTGYKIITYQDTNIYSPSYGETKTEKVKDDEMCPNNVATWTEQSRSCEQIAYQPSGQMGNSGFAIVIENDTNPKSSTYNETRQTKVEDAEGCARPNTQPQWVQQSESCETVN